MAPSERMLQVLRMASAPAGLTLPQLRAALPEIVAPHHMLRYMTEHGYLERTGTLRHYTYTPTRAGHDLLAGLPPQRPVQGRIWRRAPKVGDPLAKPQPRAERAPSNCTPIAAGYDGRYQVDAATFKGGEFMAEWRRLRGQA